MEFGEKYFDVRKYLRKEKAVKRHVVGVLEWASEVGGIDLLRGDGRKALDVGCACGYSSSVLEMLGYDTYSVDLSRWGVRQGKASGQGDFLLCDAQRRLPFKANSFELVTCFDVLEHLRFPEHAIRYMLEACASTMVCTTPNRLVEKPVRKIMGDYDETHINVKSASDWEKRIRGNSNIRLLRVETFLDLTDKLADSGFPKSFKLPGFGLTVRIIARK